MDEESGVEGRRGSRNLDCKGEERSYGNGMEGMHVYITVWMDGWMDGMTAGIGNNWGRLEALKICKKSSE